MKHTLESRPSWVQDLVVYQIYPRSFQDSNGDGIGDLPGICRRLDYLQSLGVNALWLSPVYRSPNDDNGYDISGYQEIMEEFGTMADWEALRDGCRARGIRLIMDLVVNHSSDEHPWFAESRSSRGNPKSEYYIWHDPAPDGGPPNNWASVFGGSAWEFEPRRGQYYLHIFSKKQPDLNWACKALREELLAMMDWWAQRGVDGFRVDAISYLEKPQGFPNSPLPPQPDGYSLFNNWAAGSEGTHRYIRMMHDRVFGPRGLVTVGEVSLNAPEEIASYVDPDRREFTMAIPFVPPAVEIAAWSPKKLLADACRDWRLLGERGWWARFLSNHDKPRQVSLYGSEGEHWEASAKLLALLVHTLPGTPFLYQGEELGMTNMAFSSIEEYNDPEAKNRYRQLLLEGVPPEKALRTIQLESRDNARTPMQWDSSPHAGFTTGTPWLQVNPNYTKINAAAQERDPWSILHFYRRLIALRREQPALSRGGFEALETGSSTLLAYRRPHESGSLLVVLNFSSKAALAPRGLVPEGAQPLLASTERDGGWQGERLRPYEAVLFRLP